MKFVIVGTHRIKDIVVGRLGIDAPGPGYCHFPLGRGNEWFDQLTAERKVVRYEKGRAKIDWVKDAEKRNEALDCRVYAFAALRLDSPDWQREGYALKKRAAAEAAPAAVPAADESAAEPAAARKLPAVRPLFPAAGKAQPPPAAPQKQTSVLARLTALRRRR